MMPGKKKLLKWTAAVLAIAVACAAGFLIGRNQTASEYRAEQELNYQLNRSELAYFGEIDETIYVTGHKNPDTDTVGSAVAYAELLKALGYDAVPVVLGDVNNETAYAFGTGGLEIPAVLEDATGRMMVLVDHSDYKQSADGLENAVVITVIDHHGDGSVTTGMPLIYDARPLGSTATIIWMRFRNYGIEPDPKTACAMACAILSDTRNLQSVSTTFADREALKALALLAGIDDPDALYRGMYQASISYDGMTDEEIFFGDYKEYESSGKVFGIGCADAYDEDSAKDLAERILKVLPAAQASTGADMLFMSISILHDDLNITYLVPSDEAAGEVIRTVFGDDAVYDGTSYRIEPGVSRKQTLVPAFSEVLKMYSEE